MAVAEQLTELAGQPVRLLRAPVAPADGTGGSAGADGPATPVLIHGIAGDADDWRDLLDLTGGIAPDLPGFGRSGKGGHLDFSLAGQAAALERLLDHLAVTGTLVLAGHGHGAGVALALAARAPERVARMVLVSPLPPARGAGPPRLLGALRRPLLGELTLGFAVRPVFARALERAAVDGHLDAGRIEALWRNFDPGTQRAVLRSARAEGELPAPPPAADVRILIGEADPWRAAGDLDALARWHRDATIEVAPGAGHWPWRGAPPAAARLAAAVR